MQDKLIAIDKAWQLLAMAEGNPLCECPITGSVWECISTDEVGFVFEHLHHPLTKRRQIIVIKNGKIVCND